MYADQLVNELSDESGAFESEENGSDEESEV